MVASQRQIEPDLSDAQQAFIEAVEKQSFITEGSYNMGVRFQLECDPNGVVTINDWTVPPKLRGHNQKNKIAKARRIKLSDFALSEITTQADRFGISLFLQAVPDPKSGISKVKLLEVYERHGFRLRGDFKMYRKPLAVKSPEPVL